MFFCNKNVCNILNTAYQIFNVVTKNRFHLWRHTFKKSQEYLYNCKKLKKTFLQLRCSNVLLHLKYKLPLCMPEIGFKNLMGAKALATDHRVVFILLIVGSPTRNFYRCTGCIQSNINLSCRNTQNAARKYHSLLKITHWTKPYAV